MMNTFKLRIILDAEENVVREILFDGGDHLEKVNHTIASTFELNPGEMSCFYLSDENWNQGEEIPLMDMGMFDHPIKAMADYSLDLLTETNRHLLFVYDFMNMWTFYIEITPHVLKDPKPELPLVIFSMGSRPEEAPEKDFEGNKKPGLFDDAFGEEEDHDEEELY